MRNISLWVALGVACFISAGAWAQTAASQQIIRIYMAKAQPAFDKAEADAQNTIHNEKDPSKKAKLAVIFKDGVITAEDKIFITKSLAMELDRYMTEAEANQALTFLQSPAGQHFAQAESNLGKAVKPIVKQLIQQKVAKAQGL